MENRGLWFLRTHGRKGTWETPYGKTRTSYGGRPEVVTDGQGYEVGETYGKQWRHRVSY